MDEIVIKEKGSRVLTLLFLGMGMTAISIILTFIGWKYVVHGVEAGDVYGPVYFFAGITGIIVFGFCVVFWFIRYYDQKPLVIISNAGITYRVLSANMIYIPWQLIKKITVVKDAGQDLIGFEVDDYEQFIGNFKPSIRNYINTNVKFKKPPFAISTVIGEISTEDLLDLINKYFKKNKR